MMNWRKIINWGAVALLLLGTVVLFLPRRPAYFFELKKPLKNYLPEPAAGWSSEDHPLGQTEYQASKATEILKLDDFVFRTYRRGDLDFAVYCAYWRPESQTAGEAGSHTPDKCWTNSGWVQVGEKRTDHLLTARGPTHPGQERDFEFHGAVQHVIFWHIRGGRLSGYAMGAQAAWLERAPILWENLRASHFGQIEYEQYFVRISSSRPINELSADPFFRKVVDAISDFGLVPEARGQSSTPAS